MLRALSIIQCLFFAMAVAINVFAISLSSTFDTNAKIYLLAIVAWTAGLIVSVYSTVKDWNKYESK